MTTANASAISAEVGLSRSDKPRLLPFNRKLRHLHGISIRNLALDSPSRRLRGKTFDDEAIPYTLKSPSKLLTVKESSSLPFSRSFSDLRTQGATNASTEPPKSPSPSTRKSSHGSASRPRGTLQRANTSPRQRQQALKDMVARRIANVFFSLHCGDAEDPIYISEVVQNAMNPDFRFFDLIECGPFVTRQENLTLRIWPNAIDSEQWILLLELSLSLRYLQYIGKALEDFHHPLPDNAVLFHLPDGIYTSFTNMPVEETAASAMSPLTDKVPIHAEPTSSYDALMRLSTLDQCIQDSITTRHKLASDIAQLISDAKLRSSSSEQLASARDTLSAASRAVASERKLVKSTSNKLNDLRKTLQARRDAIREGHSAQTRTASRLRENTEKLQHCQHTHKQTTDAIAGQRRRICEDLLEIYPINPVPQRPLAFTIREMPLPNSAFQDVKEDVVSAALGYVAHVVYLLSFYLAVPLPYSIHPSSSTSLITDPISLMSGSRTFPLHIKGSVFYRFEYGVFLLNKDIELVASHLGLKILDIRQTLPNLKYVLFVATAGQGELPSRKAGGVRGLLSREKEKGTPGSSRRGSVDSNDGAGTGGLRSIMALRTSG